MAAIIINDVERPQHKIKVVDLKLMEKVHITKAYLQQLLSHPKNQLGVIRKDYAILNTDCMLQDSGDARRVMTLMMILNACLMHSYSLLMIKF